MIINGENYTVDELVKKIDFNSSVKQKINSNLDLTAYQIEILSRNNIEYASVNSLKELIYYIEEALEDTLNEELELVLDEVAERDYYENTKR